MMYSLTEINFLWNLLIDSLHTFIVQSTYLNTDMSQLESSQTDERRAQSVNSLENVHKT